MSNKLQRLRQKQFDRFIEVANEHGPSHDEHGGCMYVPGGDHPGCGVGCQIKNKALRKRIAEWERVCIETRVRGLFRAYPNVETLLGGPDNLDFLSDLQKFHDEPGNWKDVGSLKGDPVKRFCERWNLAPPKEDTP